MDLPVEASAQPGVSRLYTNGEYARTSDGIVYVLGGGDNGYQVVRTERSEECFYRADELSPWSPLADECVTEADNENSAIGIVLHVGERTSLVKWPGFVRPQTWANADLEPAWH